MLQQGGIARFTTTSDTAKEKTNYRHAAELIDKCVGSRIWVIMKSEKGRPPLPRHRKAGMGPQRHGENVADGTQSSQAHCSGSTTTSVRLHSLRTVPGKAYNAQTWCSKT
ncbi:hypothetical protein MRB53_037667 [Persea americana]|nr:hypothetical protein MRB53_037667 [Persea americana]